MSIERFEKVRLLKPEYRNNISKLINDISALPVLNGLVAIDNLSYIEPQVNHGPECVEFAWVLPMDPSFDSRFPNLSKAGYGISLNIWFEGNDDLERENCMAISAEIAEPEYESLFGDDYEAVVNEVIDSCCEPDIVYLDYYKAGFVTGQAKAFVVCSNKYGYYTGDDTDYEEGVWKSKTKPTDPMITKFTDSNQAKEIALTAMNTETNGIDCWVSLI